MHSSFNAEMMRVQFFFRNFKIEFESGSYYFSAKVVSSNPADGEVYSKKHYLIEFFVTCDRWMVL